jgi:hypothetical protein
VERFSLKKLNEVEGNEQCHAGISNRFTALENLDTEVDIKGWENINILAKESLGYFELKKHNPRFNGLAKDDKIY